MSDVTTTTTIEDFIEAGKDVTITYYNLSILQQVDNIQYSTENVLYDYMDELSKMAVNVVMTDNEYNKYCYKPKLLSYDVYGSTELYFVILALNNMCDIKDFNIKKLKLINKDVLLQTLEYIYNKEQDYIYQSRETL